MKFSVHTTERMEDQIADQGIIPDKLTGEESGEEESGEEESGEQTEDSGSASEWRPDIEILFRQPIYSSDTGPRFPQELIERICEFLWDEPVQLAVSCTRICPAWYHAARRLLPEHDITWQTREALQDHAHTLTSLRNAPYRKRFQQLLIYDNASKPFAHVWPMFIPGWILPKVRVVTLGDLDWSTRTPHDSFFVYLSSYTRILTLSLRTYLEVIPSLAGNTTLKTLWIHLRDIAPLPQEIHSALTAVLSDIVSVDLQHVSIWFTLAHLEPEVLPQNHGRTPVAPDPAEAISAFHTILSREIFNGLPRHFSNFKCVEVDFYVGNIQDNPAVVATIKAYIINLFTPWLDRGIVKLVFISADSSEHITCVPASMLSEDTSSDSKVEDVQENEPVGTEQ
ncbi:uncharacterized protein C8Q71DRAFT_861473 [Rhodofomes roseus]|uniref:F-box domain-containing protein n=1 Tax=Rhodofomes roseus TaxID=34475 RepID=A0ABQ8K4M0_9APHY|nr:uncharacterized protein C8Q71DRAFT_861473 [Rhodofomes roseus]KAH9831797.1 hypothetical protein C8Q71DRAFT_861473 [Rhodofomes roseus]